MVAKANPRSRLIAVDCDGTFFNDGGYPSQYSCDVVARIVSAGHEIVAATGRSRFTASVRLAGVPAMRYAVCSNGAYLWDMQQDTLVWDSEISLEIVMEIVTRLRGFYSDVAFSWETRNGINGDDAFVELAGGIDRLETGGSAGELCDQGLYKVKVRRPGISVTDLHKEVSTLLGDLSCEISTSGAPFLEVTAPGVHKATGLEKSAVQLGYTAADTIVFGDNRNDLTMFKWAGHSVAMGNALDVVKESATAVTLSNADDGVAHYLEELLSAGTL